MRMHSLCLICVNNGWLSTCSLLLEKITAKKIWFWANFQNNEVQWPLFKENGLHRGFEGAIFLKLTTLETLKTKVGLPLLVFVLLIFMVRLPFFICYVALLRLLLNPH
jgi:hypothetical protein